jgi:hypothetical protein
VVERLQRLIRLDSLADRICGFIDATRVGYGSSKLVPGTALGTTFSERSGDPEIEARLERFVLALNAAALNVLRQTGSPSAANLLSTLAIGSCVRSRIGKACRLDPSDLALLLSAT